MSQVTPSQSVDGSQAVASIQPPSLLVRDLSGSTLTCTGEPLTVAEMHACATQDDPVSPASYPVRPVRPGNAGRLWTLSDLTALPKREATLDDSQALFPGWSW